MIEITQQAVDRLAETAQELRRERDALRRERDELLEALKAARTAIMDGDYPDGWDIARIDALLAEITSTEQRLPQS